MPDEERELERAAQHVAAGKRVVAQQHDRIAALKAAGHPVEEHERLCRVGEEVAPLAPHRSGRAQFEHTVPHARVSLRLV
jgi:hypothetical protein